MALNDVKIIQGNGGLGRPLPGEDHISSLIFHCANGVLPSGFTSSDRIKVIYSTPEAEALGVVKDFSDETKGTATLQITTAGTTGDTLKLTFTDPKGTVVDLGTYTKVASDSTATLVATAIKNMINAGTATHKFTATSSTDTVTITARPGLGVFPNTGTPYTKTIAGSTIAGTLTQSVVAGVASLKALYWYHVSEFFRIQPQGKLYLAFYAVPSTYDFAEVKTVQDYAQGKIRQFGVYINNTAYTSAHVTAAQAQYAIMFAAHKPANIILGSDISAVSDLSTLADLSALSANRVSVAIGQDQRGFGYELFKAYSKSVTCLGTLLGAVSLAKVSESVAWVGKFPLSDGVEYDQIGFANGTAFDTSSDGLISQLNTYKYIFLRKFVGLSNSYFNDSHTAVSPTDDYSKIENGRTADKAGRNIRTVILPDLNSPLTLNSDGTMQDTTIQTLASKARNPLEQMARDGELSVVEADDIVIPTNQNVASTSKVVMTANLHIIGVANTIEITVGFSL